MHTGVYFQPIAYTFPDGLQSVNGSSSTGDCQPVGCIMMPIGGSTINGCDCTCPGSSTPVAGVLTDGVIPNIDTTQRGTWTSELFVVNRNGQDSFMIGFVFSNSFLLRHVEATYFNCQIWGFGFNIYSSNVFLPF